MTPKNHKNSLVMFIRFVPNIHSPWRGKKKKKNMNTEASSHPETCCICSFILVSFLHPSLHLVFFIIKSLFFERKNEGEQRAVLGEEAVGHIYMLKAVLCVSR